MKKILLIAYLFLFFICEVNGQWYTRRYQVADINLLTKDQLNESLKHARGNCIGACAMVGVGGIGFVIFQFVRPSLEEDHGWFADLVGEQGMNDLGAFTCAGIIAASAIVAVTNLGRMSRIRSVIRKNFPAGEGTIHISAVPLYNLDTRTCHPGISLTYNF